MDTGKLIDSMKRVVKSELGSYDTTATVKRVEGDTAWVHIPGGVDETPVRLTMNAKEGDNVQVRVSDGKAFLAGNVSAPPTDDTTAEAAKAIANRAAEDAGRAKSAADIAESYATSAQASAAQSANILEGMEQAAIAAGTTLDGIYADAAEAKATTDEINTYADTAGKTVTQILEDGETAGVAAQAASEAANSALVGLSTVEDVVGVLNWITEHGTMTLTSDVTVNPAHVYFIVDPAGDYVVGGTHYSIVSEPDDADIGTYYELSIDESVENYVATHIVVDSEGLWIIPDAGGNKVLIATGSGSTYTTAGTYIVGKVGGVDTVLAEFTASGAQIGQDDEFHVSTDSNKVGFYNGSTMLSKMASDGLHFYNGNVTSVADILGGFSGSSKYAVIRSGDPMIRLVDDEDSINDRYFEASVETEDSTYRYTGGAEVRGFDFVVSSDKYKLDGTTEDYIRLESGVGTTSGKALELSRRVNGGAKSVLFSVDKSGDVTDGAGNTLSKKQDKYTGYGSEVNLSSYTSSTNYYTAPSDGIVRLRANVGTSKYIQCKVANNDGTNESLFSVSGGGSASGIIPAPIFKGQRAWISARSAAADTSFVFIPFTT